MKNKLRGYTLGRDGKYRKRVEFDVPKRAGIVNAVNLVRSRDGTLLRSESLGWIRLATTTPSK